MGKYLLGLDNGNTLSKAALFNLRGEEISISSHKVNTLYPNPGWTERDMNQVWACVVGAIKDVISKSGITPKEIVGIGCSGHGNGLYLLDKSGMPFCNAIQSLDSRANDLVEEYKKRDNYHRIFPIALQNVWPSQSAMLLAWLKKHNPNCYHQIGSVLLCKDYINYKLTGEINSDYTDMSGAGLVDVRNKCYSEALMRLYGIPELYKALPRLVSSTEVIGQISPKSAAETGLAIDTPVIGGLFDVDAGALGSGVIQSGQASIIAGTWSINQVVSSNCIVDPNIFMSTVFAVPDLWLTLEASATSATNLEWFVTQFCAKEEIEAEKRGVSVYEICNEMVESVAINEANIIFHPFLYGSNVQGTARSGFYGMAGWHSKKHLLRALYEGVVFGHLTHLEKLRKAGSSFNKVRLTGGGAQSRVWSQMFADILDVKVEVTRGNEIGALGTALTAAVGIGIYKNFDEATQQMVVVERVHEPDFQNSQLYLEKYEAYKELINVMSGPWNHLDSMG
jgi:L-xylulokinase